MSSHHIINYFEQNNVKCEDTVTTPETDFKEYENLDGYYLKIEYIEKELSIITYNIDTLEGIRYEIKIQYEELQRNKFFKGLGKINEIYKKIIDLINANKYKITKKKNEINFFLIFDDSQKEEIFFTLSKNYKDDKKEYIKILSNIIKKLRIINNETLKEKEEEKKNFKEENPKNSNNKLASIKDEREKDSTIQSFKLNCSQCLLIPQIIINSSNFPFIQTKCPNNHIEKKINLLDFVEKGNKYSKDFLKCKCKEFSNNSNLELYFCKNCKLTLCEKCIAKHNSSHKIIFEELINFDCLEHQNEFSAYCINCNTNICKECYCDHKEHEIKEFNKIIPSKEDFNKIKNKKDEITMNIDNISQLLDSYKKEFIEKIEILKNYYILEKKIIEEIFSQYSKETYNYQVIQNLRNITDFSFEEININSKESFSQKTKNILRIFDKFDAQNSKKKGIKLIKKIVVDESIHSLCYLKKHNLIAVGLNKKIILFDSKFNIKSTNKILDDKITYINELSDGKIVVANLNKYINILEIKEGKFEIYKTIETKEEKNNVVSEISNKNIICGGYQYLSVIEPSFFFKYSLKKTLELKTFISNIVEIDEESFLIGLSEEHKIMIYSNNDNELISQINNIYLKGNNYSISKISKDLIGIAGYDKSDTLRACIYFFSRVKRNICNKYYLNNVESCLAISKFSKDEFICACIGLDIDKYSDLILLSYKIESKQLIVNKKTDFKRGYYNEIKAIITYDNNIIAFDNSSNLKVWSFE